MTVRHLRTLNDLSRDEIVAILDDADAFKRLRGQAGHPRPLAGKSVALIFEKSSTRTRISFEVAVVELGGHPVVLAARDTQLGRGESIEDTARMLSRYVHAAVYRTHGHERIEALANAATIPVINGLSDTYHPCQVLADVMTAREHVKRPLSDLRVAWIGDGNNMAHSWMLAAAKLGFELVLACPDGYTPDPAVLAQVGGARVRVVRNPDDAMRGAHVVTTDVWYSMGQEEERTQRLAPFSDYSVTESRMALAAPDAIFLHCLPAHCGEEVSDAVFHGPQSRVWDEAENRLHVQKALLRFLVERS